MLRGRCTAYIDVLGRCPGDSHRPGGRKRAVAKFTAGPGGSRAFRSELHYIRTDTGHTTAPVILIYVGCCEGLWCLGGVSTRDNYGLYALHLTRAGRYDFGATARTNNRPGSDSNGRSKHKSVRYMGCAYRNGTYSDEICRYSCYSRMWRGTGVDFWGEVCISTVVWLLGRLFLSPACWSSYEGPVPSTPSSPEYHGGSGGPLEELTLPF